MSSARLTYSSLPPEVKEIANNSLGTGVLRSMMDYSTTYHLMMKVSDGAAFIGFALYHIERRKMGRRQYTTGVIDTICVDRGYRKEGFGTLLTYGALRKMSANVDRVEITLKSPDTYDPDTMPSLPILGSEEILKAMGFRKIEVIPDYFYKKSLKYGYECIVCQQRPCTCRGVLFAINATD